MVRVLRDDWANVQVHRDPFLWLSTAPGRLFSMATARSLAATFPSDGFRRLDRSARSTGKQYRNDSRPIRWPEDEGTLPPLWRDLVCDLLAFRYRTDVARLLDQEPAAVLDLRLVRHGSGDWLGPHTDREDKLFSHIIYFNEAWRPEWGGRLEILEADDPGTVVASIAPELGASALLRRADNSWHQVTPLVADPPSERRSLLVHGIRS